PRSAGVIGPFSFESLRRTSFSRAASSNSTVAGCGLQSARVFFTKAGAGGVLAEGAGVGVGAGAADGSATAEAAGGASAFGSSQPAIIRGRTRIAAEIAVFIPREGTRVAPAGPTAPRLPGASRPARLQISRVAAQAAYADTACGGSSASTSAISGGTRPYPSAAARRPAFGVSSVRNARA